MPLEDDKTYLSEFVHYVLVEIARKTESQSNNHCQYIRKDLTFNWNKIQFIFGDLKDDFDILEQSDSWYIETLNGVWLAIHGAGKALLTAKETELERLWELCKLTGYQDQLIECFNTFKKNTEIGGVLVTLKLTAMLERLLGNIFLIEGKSVPFLLRDLLNTPELRKILGKIPVTFMQLIVGSPKGLNLRNVIWHGFILPDELHSCLICSLFLLFPSIEQLLPTRVFPMRPQLTNFEEYTRHLENLFPDILDDNKSVLDILESSRYISSQHLSLWKASYQLINEEKYGDCLILLFPQLEHLLRSVYCDINECSHRLLTAESSTLYTTLDEILLLQLSNQDSTRNQLGLVLGEGLLLLLEDILSIITGPRLRDKLSHGECSLRDIPRTLANHVFCIALGVCIKADRNVQTNRNNDNTEMSPNLNHTCCYRCEEDCPEVFHLALLHTCETYESKFHVGTMLQRSVIDVLSQVGSLTNLSVPPEISIDPLQTESKVKNLKNCLFGYGNLSPSECLGVLCRDCTQIKLKTLNRPKHETELIILLSNTIKNISSTATKITDGSNQKFSQWQARTLRSRARQTYQRMHRALPTLQCALFCMIAIVIAFLKILNQTNTNQCQGYIRFAKKMLKVVENTSSLCDLEKNKWNESCKMVSDFSESTIRHCRLLFKNNKDHFETNRIIIKHFEDR